MLTTRECELYVSLWQAVRRREDEFVLSMFRYFFMEILTIVEEPCEARQVPALEVYRRFCAHLESKGIPDYKTGMLQCLYRFMTGRNAASGKETSDHFAETKVEEFLKIHMGAVLVHANRGKAYTNLVCNQS